MNKTRVLNLGCAKVGDMGVLQPSLFAKAVSNNLAGLQFFGLWKKSGVVIITCQ